MLSKYGLKIKNFSCGILYEYNLGLREHLTYTNAMFTNNLLSYYLVEHGLKVSKDGRTRDIIGINFDLGAKSYAETRKKIEHILKSKYGLSFECAFLLVFYHNLCVSRIFSGSWQQT